MSPLSADSQEARAYRLLQRTITFATLCVIVTVSIVFAYASNTSQDRCDDLQEVRSFVLKSTERSISSLPTIDYYRNHPDERDEALKTLEEQRQEFLQPLDCSLF